MAGSDSELVEAWKVSIRKSEAKFASDPDNAAEHLRDWGFFLYSLSETVDRQEASDIAKDAISKLEEALLIDPKAHDTWKWLGRGLKFYVSLDLAEDEALIYLQKTVDYFQEALNKDPGNNSYIFNLTSATLKLAAYSKETVGKVPEIEHYLKSLKASTQDSPRNIGNKLGHKSSVISTQGTRVSRSGFSNKKDDKTSKGNGPYGKYVWYIVSVVAAVGVGMIFSKKGF